MFKQHEHNVQALTNSRRCVVWQDSHLSITYDRASSTATIKYHQAIRASPSSYAECMRMVCDIGLDIVRKRSEQRDYQHELSFVEERRNKLLGMLKNATPHLRDIKACKSMKDQLEHWNLYLHRSYVTSELYRPFLKRNSTNSDLTTSLKATCVESLANTVDAFLGLENLTRFARQSWAAVHRALSSALLLGILEEPPGNQQVRTLLDRLIGVISELSTTLEPSEVSAPIARSIAALRLLNSRESGTVRSGQLTGLDLPIYWHSNDSGMSSTQYESGYSADSNIGSEEGSPHTLIDKIMWGPQLGGERGV